MSCHGKGQQGRRNHACASHGGGEVGGKRVWSGRLVGWENTAYPRPEDTSCVTLRSSYLGVSVERHQLRNDTRSGLCSSGARTFRTQQLPIDVKSGTSSFPRLLSGNQRHSLSSRVQGPPFACRPPPLLGFRDLIVSTISWMSSSVPSGVGATVDAVVRDREAFLAIFLVPFLLTAHPGVLVAGMLAGLPPGV